MNQKTLVEKYSTSRFAHIERRQDAWNQECNVINDITGESHSTHATMEGAKHSLSRLDLKLRLNNRTTPPPSIEPDESSSTFHCNIDQEISGMPDLTENPLGWA